MAFPSITTGKKPGNEAVVEYGQDAAATDVVGLLKSDKTIAVAIEGPYGSGKTEILHRVKARALQELKDQNVVLVEYEPWRYAPDATTLRRTFLNKLIDSCPKTGIQDLPARVTSKPRTIRLEAGEPKDVTTQDFWKIVKQPLKLFGIIGGIAILTYFLALALLPALGWQVPNGLVIILAFAAAMATAIGDKLVQRTYDLHFQTVTDERETSTTEIDDFESEYHRTLKALGPNRRVVALVDNIDRCTDAEIQTVLSGLATYLHNGDLKDEAPISFVCAIDGQRTEEILRGDVDETSKPAAQKLGKPASRFNYLGKHFDAFIRVPQPDLEALAKIIDSHAKRLNWKIEPANLVRLARLSAKHCAYNLRAIQSAIIEASILRIQATRIIVDHADPNLSAILKDDELMFAVALLKSSTPDGVLRAFLGEGRYWRTNEHLDGIPIELLEAFRLRKLDPMPLLGVGVPTSNIVHMKDLSKTAEAMAMQTDPDWQKNVPVKEMLPDLALEVALYAIRARPPTDGTQNQNMVKRAGELLDFAGNEVRHRRDTVLEMLPRVWKYIETGGHSGLPHDAWNRWASIAWRAGPEAIQSALADNCYLWSQRPEPTIQQMVKEAQADAKAGEGIILGVEAILKALRPRLSNYQVISQYCQHLAPLADEGDLSKSRLMGEVAMEWLERWDFQHGMPPIILWHKPTRLAIAAAGLQDRAEKLVKKANLVSQGSKHVTQLYEQGWDEFTPAPVQGLIKPAP
jgi:hypothetical protein